MSLPYRRILLITVLLLVAFLAGFAVKALGQTAPAAAKSTGIVHKN